LPMASGNSSEACWRFTDDNKVALSINPNYGSSTGGTKIIVEGTGFLQGGTVMIGELPATTQVKSDTTIEATSPLVKRRITIM